jgi:hypothetical protein
VQQHRFERGLALVLQVIDLLVHSFPFLFALRDPEESQDTTHSCEVERDLNALEFELDAREELRFTDRVFLEMDKQQWSFGVLVIAYLFDDRDADVVLRLDAEHLRLHVSDGQINLEIVVTFQHAELQRITIDLKTLLDSLASP